MKDRTTLWLANRLNQIMVELDRMWISRETLEAEYDEIVYELWSRYPHLRDNPDIQPKKKVKEKK